MHRTVEIILGPGAPVWDRLWRSGLPSRNDSGSPPAKPWQFRCRTSPNNVETRRTAEILDAKCSQAAMNASRPFPSALFVPQRWCRRFYYRRGTKSAERGKRLAPARRRFAGIGSFGGGFAVLYCHGRKESRAAQHPERGSVSRSGSAWTTGLENCGAGHSFGAAAGHRPALRFGGGSAALGSPRLCKNPGPSNL